MKTIKTLQILFSKSTYRVISVHAGNASYYMILSVLPVLALLLSLVAIFSLPETSFWSTLEGVIPAPLLQTILSVFRYSKVISPMSVLSVSLLAWLWTASKGISAIMDGMDAALRIQNRQGFLKKRLIAVLQLIALSFGIIFAMMIQLLGVHVSMTLKPFLPAIPDFLLLLLKHKLFSSVLILSIVFFIVYKLHPGSNIPVRFSLLGGLLCALGWTVFSAVFSIYVYCFADRYHLFGDLGILLLSAVWLRACMIVLLCGFKYAGIRSRGYRSVLRYIFSLYRNIHE